MAALQHEAAKPVLTLSLEHGNDSNYGRDFHLTRPSFHSSNFVDIKNHSPERRLTLVCESLVLCGRYKRLDAQTAVKTGLLEVFESGKPDPIRFPPASSQPLGSVDIAWPKQRVFGSQRFVSFETDSMDEMWKACLQPNRTYEFRLSEDGGQTWAYFTDDKSADSLEDIPSSQRLHVCRDTISAVEFNVYAFPPSPKLFAKLSLPKECHLSGTPPFTMVIEYSTDSEQTITFDKSRSGISSFWLDLHGVYQLIDCDDVESGEKVDWPAAFGCFESDPHPAFPDDDDFVEVGPGQTWQFTYTIARSDCVDDTGSSSMGELELLKGGRTYTAQVASDIRSFRRWKFGNREDLLKGNAEEKMQRWKIDDVKTGSLVVTRREPVVFSVIE